MRVAKQRYRRRAIDELKPHPRNPRRGDVAAIRESIQKNDFVGAVVVQRGTDYILAGRHRVLAAEEEGATDVPVLEVDVDDDAALRILLADNRTSDRATYDDEALHDLLREIGAAEATLEGTGYSFDDYRHLEAELAAPPAAPDPTRKRDPARVELALGGDRLAVFLANAKRLASEYGTSEISDTVYECLDRAVRTLP